MSKARFIYRRMGRKKSPSTTQSQGKQAAQPFFDFGGERSFFSGKSSDTAVNRKCDHCEQEEKKVHKKDDPVAGKHAPPDVSSKIQALQGGSPLPAATRTFFESKFGADLSKVKIHTGSDAADLAVAVNAKAFTYKDNIVFNKGEYNPESESGKKLLAHELTHVIQQGGGVSKMEKERKDKDGIQRAPKTSDFKVEGLDPNSAGDNSKIRFDMGSTLVPAVELPKIDTNATPADKPLTITGFASEEGTDAQNASLAAQRARNVATLLHKKKHKPDKETINSKGSAGKGIVEYRKMRVVEIVETPSKGPAPSSVPQGGAVAISCGSDIPVSFALAAMTTLTAFAKLINPGPKEKAIFAMFFGKNKVEDVRANLLKILSEIVRHSSAFNPASDCHSESADADCVGAGAYCNTNLVPAKMVFCESFVNYSAPKKAEYIVHEASHGTPGLMTQDTGYEQERIIKTLSDAEKLNNADSYLLLVRLLNNPAAVGYSAPVDTIAGTGDKAEIDFANKILAYLEKWVGKSALRMSSVYGEVNNGVLNPAAWKNANPGNYYIETMHLLSSIFGLTDPGTVNPLVPPTKSDKLKVAGIFDRYNHMAGVTGSGITVEKTAKGTEGWAKNYGQKVEVLPSFFTKSETDAIRHFIRLMSKSASDIPTSLVESYVEGADKMRKEEKVGP